MAGYFLAGRYMWWLPVSGMTQHIHLNVTFYTLTQFRLLLVIVVTALRLLTMTSIKLHGCLINYM